MPVSARRTDDDMKSSLTPWYVLEVKALSRFRRATGSQLEKDHIALAVREVK